MTGFLADAAASRDCSTAGFPINYEVTHTVTAGDNTTATPLKPAAAPDGVMSGFQIKNNTCEELTLTLENYSTNSDCNGCTNDTPLSQTVTYTVPAGATRSYPGLWIDYSINGGTITQDGSVLVGGSRVLDTCCQMTGMTSATNTLVIPTI